MNYLENKTRINNIYNRFINGANGKLSTFTFCCDIFVLERRKTNCDSMGLEDIADPVTMDR